MIAVTDIGSNSIRFAIYNPCQKGAENIFGKRYPVGLAAYVTEGALSERGIEVCANVLSEIKSITAALNIQEVLLFATASLRNITNSAAVLDRIRQLTGLNIDIISGEQEAAYDLLACGEELDDSHMICDIGGGSTELIFADKTMYSFPYGSLKAFKSLQIETVGTDEEYLQVTAAFYDLLKAVKPQKIRKLTAIGGSMQALVAMNSRLGLSTQFEDVDKLFELLKTDRKAVINCLLQCSPDRIHTFFCGLAILRAIGHYFSIEEVAVNFNSCREGYLYAYLASKKED